jgi:hypothetical protein
MHTPRINNKQQHSDVMIGNAISHTCQYSHDSTWQCGHTRLLEYATGTHCSQQRCRSNQGRIAQAIASKALQRTFAAFSSIRQATQCRARPHAQSPAFTRQTHSQACLQYCHEWTLCIYLYAPIILPRLGFLGQNCQQYFHPLCTPAPCRSSPHCYIHNASHASSTHAQLPAAAVCF